MKTELSRGRKPTARIDIDLDGEDLLKHFCEFCYHNSRDDFLGVQIKVDKQLRFNDMTVQQKNFMKFFFEVMLGRIATETKVRIDL